MFAYYFYPHYLYSPWNLLINIYPKKSTTPLFLPGPPPLNILIFPNFSKSGPSQHLPWARCLNLSGSIAPNARVKPPLDAYSPFCNLRLFHSFTPCFPHPVHARVKPPVDAYPNLQPSVVSFFYPLLSKSCSSLNPENPVQTMEPQLSEQDLYPNQSDLGLYDLLLLPAAALNPAGSAGRRCLGIAYVFRLAANNNSCALIFPT
jgi:hypothetical protein